MSTSGTLTPSYNTNGVAVTTYPQPGITDISLVWVSDASAGTVTQNTPVIVGTLLDVRYIPGTGGVQPSNGYAITLKDPIGTDILNGTASSLSNSASTKVFPGQTITDGTTPASFPYILNDVLVFALTGGGNSKSGTVVLRVKN